MGFELDAFLARISELRTWRDRLPSAVVCELGGSLGLVPVTGKVLQELRARLGEEANRLDAAQRYPTYPSASQEAAVRRWGKDASGGTAVAYLSIGEFGDQSHEEATLWSDSQEVLSRVRVSAILVYFRDQVGIDLGDKPIDFERYRGEDAAEKWAAAANERGQADSGTRWVKAADLKMGPIQHETLTSEQTERIAQLHQRLEPVDGWSLEKRTELFKREMSLDRELAICERIADVCERLNGAMAPLSREQRREIYALVSIASGASSVEEVLDHYTPRTITRAQARQVLAEW